MKDQKDIKPLIVKLGVTLVLSLAGFLLSQLRPKKLPPSSPCSSSGGDKLGFVDDELQSLPAKPSFCDSSISSHENYEESSRLNVITQSTILGLSPTSTNSSNSGDGQGFLLPEFNDIANKEFEIPQTHGGVSLVEEVETSVSVNVVKENETDKEEIMNLKNMVRVLQERENNLENQLLEYYGLKEQESAMMELQNRLKINMTEVKLLTLRLESLQADKKRLEAEVADHSKVMVELETARETIKMLETKIRSDTKRNKEELSSLKQKVSNLLNQEFKTFWNESDVQKNLQRLQEMEDELAELTRANLRLQHEKTELATRFESTKTNTSSDLETSKTEELKETNQHLREENAELRKEIERLQASRLADVEELVYLRWLNACLRYELRHLEVPSGKLIARDLSKSSSPKSESIVKQLIVEYANSEVIYDRPIGLIDFDFEYWSSSQDSNDFDDTSIDISSTTKSQSTSKSKLVNKFKKFLVEKNMEKGYHDSSSTDRTSASCVASRRRESSSGGSYEEMVRTEAKSDDHRTKPVSSSQSTIRASFHTQRPINSTLDDARHVRSKSDIGSSYRYKRLVLRDENLSSEKNRVDEEDLDLEKLELIKLAEALEVSNERSKPHKRATSYSSY